MKLALALIASAAATELVAGDEFTKNTTVWAAAKTCTLATCTSTHKCCKTVSATVESSYCILVADAIDGTLKDGAATPVDVTVAAADCSDVGTYVAPDTAAMVLAATTIVAAAALF
jgi:hypothetical protein